MGGLIYDDGKSYRVVTIDDDGDVWLGGEWEYWMCEIRLPDIAEEELLDKGKGDFLSKSIAVIQTSWFVLQCIARNAQGLVITELELGTLAFATLNVITYFLWWSKPLNAGYPIYFKKNGNRCSGPKVRPVSRWSSEGYTGVTWPWSSALAWMEYGFWDTLARIKMDIQETSLPMTIWERVIKRSFLAFFSPLNDMMVYSGDINQTSVPPYYAGHYHPFYSLVISFCSLIGILFGGIHLTGWNSEFPTTFEQILWRVSSVAISVEPALVGFSFLYTARSWFSQRTITQDILTVTSLWIGPHIYTFCRIALLVQAFFALRNLPPSVYQNVQWSAYIPHI
ncbi:hypothetical protein AX16_006177 [Volvariella volvacea WC 439]|nr:hypothetical protein AX16_006177 [Volvariella volvacea WC 439]